MTIIQTRKGDKIEYAGEAMMVAGQKGFDCLTLKSANGEYFDVPLAELSKNAASRAPKTLAADPIRLGKVEAYKAAFSALLEAEKRKKSDVTAAAERLNIGISSAYRALARYDLSRDINDLPPPTRPGGRGQSRLNEKAEAIITATLDETLLTRRQHRPKLFFDEVKKRLKKAGFQVSDAVLRNRIAAIPAHKWKKRRQGYDAAAADAPHRGAAPTGQRPLQTIQMDHWKMDIQILSDDRLTVIGRVWITLAIDLFTRVIWGWHLSLNAPSTASVTYCMIRGMTRKDAYLESIGVKADMPFWGDPEALHLDNAGEFIGTSMASSCDHFRIQLKFRPVKSPQYGCHIERLNNTLARKFEDLPGATGSKPGDQKQLRSEATAAFTFSDLEQQIAMLINEYHQTPHIGIGGKTPYETWSAYYFGPNGQKRPTPPIRIDDLALRIPWYPLKHPAPTLQAYGIRVDYLDYYGEPIEHLVRNHKGEKIVVRQDPLDVTHIYVLHPVRREMIEVPCRYHSFPVASIWELQAARKEALRQKRKPTPEALAILIEERRAHQTEAEKKTKTAAREVARRSRDQDMRRKAPKAPAAIAERIVLDLPQGGAKPQGTAKPTKPQGAVKPLRPASGFHNTLSLAEAASLREAMAKGPTFSDAELDAYLEGQ